MAKEIKPGTTPEEKEVDAEVIEEETTDDVEENDEDEASDVENKPDYKAIAEEERKKREKAEASAADAAFKLRDLKRKGKEEPEDDEDDDDKPITKKDLNRIINETSQQTEKRLLKDNIKRIANDFADSPEEAEAMIEVHSNRTFPPDLSLEDQLEEVHAIVNRKKLLSTNSELKRALKSKQTASKDIATAHKDTPSSTPSKIAPDLKKSLENSGFKYDSVSKLYKKKLPSGKFLYKDHKTKPVKTWVA